MLTQEAAMVIRTCEGVGSATASGAGRAATRVFTRKGATVRFFGLQSLTLFSLKSKILSIGEKYIKNEILDGRLDG